MTPYLEYFTESEFIREENWFPLMSPRLLVLLDTFRHLTGKCIISPHKDAIGRRNDTDSQHNIEKWGEVRAVDVFPTLEPKGLTDQFQLQGGGDKYFTWAIAEEWIYTAKQLNFGAIGIYLDWTYNGEKRIGTHLDVRKGLNTITWGRISGNYVSLDKAMDQLV